MTTNRWRGRFITSVVVVLALIVTALLVGLRDNNGGGSKPSGNESTTTTTNPGNDSEVPTGDLEVKPGDILPEAARCTSDKFIPNSLPSAEKLWSDAVSTKFESSDPNEMLKALMAEHCGNPTLLDMTIKGLKEVKIGNFSVWEHNPWMADFLERASGGMRKTFLTKKEGKDGIFVTAEYQLFAEMVNTILLDYKVKGVMELQSVRNWHLPGPTAGELPRVVENENQEGLPALVLVYTIKDNCKGVSVIGYNAGDKRFEIFGSAKCNETPPCTNCGTTPPVTTMPVITTATTEVGRKGEPATTTPPPPTTQPSGPTTTLQCVYGTHRDPATGQCVSDNPPNEDPAPDPSVPSGGNNGPITDPGA
jgi:hypothetical protein